MRNLLALVTVSLVLAACGGGGGEYDVTNAKRGKGALVAEHLPGVAALRTQRLDFAACFAEGLTDDAAQTSRCPTFALLSLDYLASQCAAHGGTLKAREPSEAWSLDVDGDASAEVLVDLIANFDCVGAPTAFACGSTGCPLLLFKKRDDTWAEIGAINADDGPGIEVLATEAGKFAPLRGGCLGMQPCSEFTYYEWNGQAYQRTWINFKGHPVDVAPGGLMTLTQDAAVLDAPGGRKAQALDEYPVGTAVIVIGTARDAPWSFVSPCNACRRGFVDTALLKKQS
jgi:hypothetical protein